MPGRHATLVGNASADGAASGKMLAEPGLIVRHLAEVCLTRWGVKLDKMLKLSEQDLKSCHEVLNRDDGKYQAMRKHAYTLLTESRKDERLVSLGDKGAAFSSVKGATFQPDSALATPVAWGASAYKEIR
ncbi:hypothetical protein D9M71_704520 [compost metagenome]